MQKAAVETVADLKNASRAGIEYAITNNKVKLMLPPYSLTRLLLKLFILIF